MPFSELPPGSRDSRRGRRTFQPPHPRARAGTRRVHLSAGERRRGSPAARSRKSCPRCSCSTTPCPATSTARRSANACAPTPDPAVAQLPVIMLTGMSGEEQEVFCLQAGRERFRHQAGQPRRAQGAHRHPAPPEHPARPARNAATRNSPTGAPNSNATSKPRGSPSSPSSRTGLPAHARLGRGDALSARHPGRRRHLRLAAAARRHALFSGSPTPPATARPPRCTPPWPSCSFATPPPRPVRPRKSCARSTGTTWPPSRAVR